MENDMNVLNIFFIDLKKGSSSIIFIILFSYIDSTNFSALFVKKFRF